MITYTNGVVANWSEEVHALFRAKLAAAPALPKGAHVTSANHYMPRPAVDEYNRGSPFEGFTYTVKESDSYLSPSEVHQIYWTPEKGPK